MHLSHFRMEIPFVFTLLQSGVVHGLAFWFDVAYAGSKYEACKFKFTTYKSGLLSLTSFKRCTDTVWCSLCEHAPPGRWCGCLQLPVSPWLAGVRSGVCFRRLCSPKQEKLCLGWYCWLPTTGMSRYFLLLWQINFTNQRRPQTHLWFPCEC